MDRQIHVLILEDRLEDAELMRRELRKAGLDFTAQWAQDGTAYRQALEKAAPDLILTDYSVPGFGGLVALSLARARFPGVPVIIVSGAIGEEVAIETLKSGATDYVLKQRLSRLGPVVRRALQESDLESEKNRAQQSLRDSEELSRLLIEAVSDCAIIMLDPDGRVATWNAGAQRIKGYAAEEIIGKHFSIFYPQEDISAGRPQQALDAAVAQGQYADEGWRVRRDGSQFWASVALAAVRSESGELRGFAKVTRDMTARKRAEENLRATNEELARFNRAMVGRELRMIELKKEVNDLCALAGQPPHYSLDFEKEQP